MQLVAGGEQYIDCSTYFYLIPYIFYSPWTVHIGYYALRILFGTIYVAHKEINSPSHIKALCIIIFIIKQN